DQLPIQILQRQPSLASVSDDSQNSFGFTHLALLVVWLSGYLPPFAMWTAFPSPDYYGGSVAIGLAPRRRSRVSLSEHVLAWLQVVHSSLNRTRCSLTSLRRLRHLTCMGIGS